MNNKVTNKNTTNSKLPDDNVVVKNVKDNKVVKNVKDNKVVKNVKDNKVVKNIKTCNTGKNNKKVINKTIWMLWFQGWDLAPELYKRCKLSWIKNNPTWTTICLDENNLHQYVEINQYFNVNSKNITLTHRSDIIRLLVLLKYGGIWVDASTYCYTPLDDWLPVGNGFFAFKKPAKSRPLSSWLIYAEKDNLILLTFSYYYLSWWQVHDHTDEYFIFHNMFRNILNNNDKFKLLWSDIQYLSADGPHSLMLLATLPPTKNNLDRIQKSPVYKFNIKICNTILPGSILDFGSLGMINDML